MKNSGWSKASIARKLGIGTSSVQRIVPAGVLPGNASLQQEAR